MCWIAAIPAALAIGQGIMGAQNAKAQGAFQSVMGQQNAAYKLQAADDALARGAISADEQRQKTAQTIGSQRTGFAGNGIDVNSGTAALVQDDAAMLGELDALTLANNAAREAYGYQVGAQNDLMNAAYAQSTAKSNAFGSILGGASGAAGSLAGGA